MLVACRYSVYLFVIDDPLMASRSDSSKHTSRIILLIAGLLVLTSLGYFAYQYYSEKKAHQEDIVKIEDLRNEILGLEERILNFEMTMDEKDVELADKQRMIEENQQQLKQLASQLERSKQSDRSNLAKIKELEQRLEMSQRVLGQYREEVKALEARNAQLTGQVDSLRKSEMTLRNRSLSLRKKQDSALQALQATNEVASTLKARDFSVSRVDGVMPDKAKEVFRRWTVRNLEFCFTVLDNALAEAGDRTLYLVYENPDGSINTNSESGTFSYQGRSLTYTLKTEITYNNLSQEVCMKWVRPDDFNYQKGPQYLSVYADDNLLGQHSFQIGR